MSRLTLILWQIIDHRLVMVEVIDRRPEKRRAKQTVKGVFERYKRATARHRAIDVPFEVVDLGTRPVGSRGRFTRVDASRGSKARHR